MSGGDDRGSGARPAGGSKARAAANAVRVLDRRTGRVEVELARPAAGGAAGAIAAVVEAAGGLAARVRPARRALGVLGQALAALQNGADGVDGHVFGARGGRPGAIGDGPSSGSDDGHAFGSSVGHAFRGPDGHADGVGAGLAPGSTDGHALRSPDGRAGGGTAGLVADSSVATGREDRAPADGVASTSVASLLLAPASGRALVIPAIDGQAIELPGSGARIGLLDLTGDPVLAEQYAGGALLLVRLSAQDAGLVRFPCAGAATRERRLGPGAGGTLLGPGAPGAAAGARALSRLQSRAFGDLVIIEMASSPLAAAAQLFEPGPLLAGDAKSRFGAAPGRPLRAVAVLVEARRLCFDADLVRASAMGLPARVRAGEPVARRPRTGHSSERR